MWCLILLILHAINGRGWELLFAGLVGFFVGPLRLEVSLLSIKARMCIFTQVPVGGVVVAEHNDPSEL